MPYTVEDSPEIYLINGQKWRNPSDKFVFDRNDNSYLSYLFREINRDKGTSHQIFCFVKEKKSIFLNVNTSFIDGDWKRKLFNIFGITTSESLRTEFRRMGGYPSFYPEPGPLDDNEKALLLLMAMRAFIDFGQIGNSPKDREHGATVFVRQNIDKTGWIPNTPLSVEDIETILKRRQDIDAP